MTRPHYMQMPEWRNKNPLYIKWSHGMAAWGLNGKGDLGYARFESLSACFRYATEHLIRHERGFNGMTTVEAIVEGYAGPRHDVDDMMAYVCNVCNVEPDKRVSSWNRKLVCDIFEALTRLAIAGYKPQWRSWIEAGYDLARTGMN